MVLFYCLFYMFVLIVCLKNNFILYFMFFFSIELQGGIGLGDRDLYQIEVLCRLGKFQVFIFGKKYWEDCLFELDLG